MNQRAGRSNFQCSRTESTMSVQSQVVSEARRRASQLLLDFYKGRITNDQMVDDWPPDSGDEVLKATFWAIWGLYDDLHEHYIDADVKHSFRVAKHVHKCLLFLKSDMPYEWSGIGPGTVFSRVLELFNDRRARVNSAGELRAWPFYRYEDYRRLRRELRAAN